jgi:hypothetical protein
VELIELGASADDHPTAVGSECRYAGVRVDDDVAVGTRDGRGHHRAPADADAPAGCVNGLGDDISADTDTVCSHALSLEVALDLDCLCDERLCFQVALADHATVGRVDLLHFNVVADDHVTGTRVDTGDALAQRGFEYDISVEVDGHTAPVGLEAQARRDHKCGTFFGHEEATSVT